MCRCGLQKAWSPFQAALGKTPFGFGEVVVGEGGRGAHQVAGMLSGEEVGK